ncbi:MAG: hypothetical protein ABR915_05095 [Thermoguttaceae bacterium]|jgi:hypothetical protein
MPEAAVVVEVFGEGKADIGADPNPRRPTAGIVPILLDRLCGRPGRMLVKCMPIPYLQRKRLHQKVQVAKQQAHGHGSHAAVFVVDSEGGPKELKAKRAQLEEGRDRKLPDFPMAVGVAHPCIESWLLADAAAIRRGLDLPATPAVPADPESLPAPCHDADENPKRVLCKLAGVAKKELSADEKDCIARAMNDLALVRQRCPLGFAPFADEAERHIRPLFKEPLKEQA